jgi:hypothetical protein
METRFCRFKFYPLIENFQRILNIKEEARHHEPRKGIHDPKEEVNTHIAEKEHESLEDYYHHCTKVWNKGQLGSPSKDDLKKSVKVLFD